MPRPRPPPGGRRGGVGGAAAGAAAGGAATWLRADAAGRPLRKGALVWVATGGGRRAIGRLEGFVPHDGSAACARRVSVQLLDGPLVEVAEDAVSEADGLGCPAGDDSSRQPAGCGFDVFWAPQASPESMRQEISMCLFERGYCVIRFLQSAGQLEGTIRAARDLKAKGTLIRMPEEVEEHYIGAHFPAKVAWLEPGETLQDELLTAMEINVEQLAGLIQEFAEDLLGDSLSDRTPGILALSLQDDEEEDWECPQATDEELGECLHTWRRQLLKAVHFFGPGRSFASLLRRHGRRFERHLPELDSMDGGVDRVDLALPPGTLLLYDPRLLSLTHERPLTGEEQLLYVVGLLKSMPGLFLDGVTGDLSSLTQATGPPPPPGDGLVNVTAFGTRMSASFNEPESVHAGLVGCIDCVTRIPFARFDIDVYLAVDQDNMLGWQTYARHMSVVEGADMFAAKTFDISIVEAKGMDPRQRHVLEVGAKALSGIGITKQSANRQVRNAGVAVGTDGHEWPEYPKEDLGGLGNSSNALGITANRFSFVFNLRGPNFIVDTACSASLYAAHYMKMSLCQRNWDPLEFCLAIGTQLFINIGGFIGCAQAHMLSQTGRCFTFNATADGYQRGDGTSGFVMEYGGVREDGYGLFRGSNANQDGRSASLTAPSGPAQEQCIWGAVREARMEPPEATVWECHGTGTSLGDPIEVGAVRKVQVKTPRQEPLMIGSVKSNMGHLEGGAAMSAIVKCILQVHSARCCPTSHFSVLNPHLAHSQFDAFYETECARFTYDRGHSQVSSFGFGGSNGHGIFWGQGRRHEVDPLTLVRRELLRRPAPEVRPMGLDPDEWESDWPDFDARDAEDGGPAPWLISLSPV